MSEAMVPPRPGRQWHVGLRARHPRLGRAVGAPADSLHFSTLSPAGAQPMVDPVTGHVLVFNGEIYNFGDLRRRLVAEGQEFQSHRRHGRHAARARPARARRGEMAARHVRLRLLGTRSSAGFLLARDALGIKPLYLARSWDPGRGLVGGIRLGASCLAGLRACWARLALTRRPWATVCGTVRAGPGTAVTGVDLLWPGRLIELDGAGKEVRQEDFWPIPDRAPDPTMDEDGLAAILEEGLKLHPRQRCTPGGLPFRRRGLVGHGKLGASAQPRAPSTPSPWPSRSRNSMRGRSRGGSLPPLAPMHHEVVLTEGRFVENLEAALDSLDQPTFDGLNAYYMSHAIRAAGFHRGALG